MADGSVVGIARFGESAPAAALYRYFGITPERVRDVVLDCIGDAP